MKLFRRLLKALFRILWLCVGKNVGRTVNHVGLQFTLDFFKGLLVKYVLKCGPPGLHNVDIVNG